MLNFLEFQLTDSASACFLLIFDVFLELHLQTVPLLITLTICHTGNIGLHLGSFWLILQVQNEVRCKQAYQASVVCSRLSVL